MDLKLFLEPIKESLIEAKIGDSSFYHQCKKYGEKLPPLDDVELAIIGINENHDGRFKDAADVVRKKLYQLQKTSGSGIADLGNFRLGVDEQETVLRIKEVCEYLITKNILPVLVGGNHSLDFGMYRAFEDMEKMVTLTVIDSTIDVKSESESTPGHIEEILLHTPNYLFNFNHIAHQSYITNSASLKVLEKLYFNTFRVGVVHENIKDMEPVIRESDILSFDMKAIRASDFTASPGRQPFGLTAEQACQLSWYAGINEKLSTAGFFEYEPAMDNDEKDSASVLATMLWYFMEGFYNRKDHLEFKTNDYMNYVVSMPSTPETIDFYKSKTSDKWWMKVPVEGKKGLYSRDFIVPCSYADYTKATLGEVPDRYINTQARLI